MNRLVPILMLLLPMCAPPPSSWEDLPPCAALRRQVCGVHDECVMAGAEASACDRCKAELCAFVRALEDDDLQLTCAVEAQSRPQYPICRAPAPLPTLPPPPLLVSIQCEAECSLVPYPPKPPLP